MRSGAVLSCFPNLPGDVVRAMERAAPFPFQTCLSQMNFVEGVKQRLDL
jgi:hypothetical protein